MPRVKFIRLHRIKVPKKAQKKKKFKKKERTVALLSPERGFGFADRAMLKLRWAQYNNIQHAINPYAFHIYRMNSLGDPDFTGGGGQPVWHDETATIYNKYKVYDCYAKISLYNLTEDMPIIVSVSRYNQNQPSGIGAYSGQIPEASKDSFVRTLAAYGSGSEKNHTTFYMKTNMKKFMKEYFKDSTQAVALGATPTNVAWLQVTAQSLDSSTPVQCRANVELVFNTMVYQTDLVDRVEID